MTDPVAQRIEHRHFDESISTIGVERIRLAIYRNGYDDEAYMYGASLLIREGSNDSSPMIKTNISVREARALRDLLTRALMLASPDARA